MTTANAASARIGFLVRVVRREIHHLVTTNDRLFVDDFTRDRIVQLDSDPDLAERVDAFVSRFSRLQDTVGDKLLPQILIGLGEQPGAVIDNLDRAERLGFIESSDAWLTLRQLRNQMVHEYIEDPDVLVDALNAGHQGVPVLTDAANRLVAEAESRGWV